MSWFEKLLCKVFPYTDILREGTNELYLRRWFLYPRDKDFGKNKRKGRLYLHKFYRGDEDLHLHDHPWPFTSLILTQGYWEETMDDVRGVALNSVRDYRKRLWYGPFSLLRRPATWRHRVILKNKTPVWTIVKTGVKERGWGFWIGNQLCPWRQYDHGNCLVTTKEGTDAQQVSNEAGQSTATNKVPQAVQG